MYEIRTIVTDDLYVCLSVYLLLCDVAVSVGDEQQIERMYEMLDSHQKRAAAAAAAAASAQQASARRDTRTDADTGIDTYIGYGCNRHIYMYAQVSCSDESLGLNPLSLVPSVALA